MNGAVAPLPAGSQHPALAPDEAFRTKDGYVAITAPTERCWFRLCGELGIDELIEDERFASNAARLANQDELHALVETKTVTRSSAEWTDRLTGAGVAAAEFTAPTSLLKTLEGNAQVNALGLVARVPSGYGMVATQVPHWRFTRTPAAIEKGPPQLGEHTDLVLTHLNSKRELLAALDDAKRLEQASYGETV